MIPTQPMTKSNIRPFDLAGASDREYEALNRLVNHSKAETLPDDPPDPVHETKAFMQNIPPCDIVKAWAGWDTNGDKMTSRMAVWFSDTKENTHAIMFAIYVESANRRQGIGRELLKKVVETARLKTAV
jgi:GNAT superfamily N-acetyltransferase